MESSCSDQSDSDDPISPLRPVRPRHRFPAAPSAPDVPPRLEASPVHASRQPPPPPPTATSVSSGPCGPEEYRQAMKSLGSASTRLLSQSLSEPAFSSTPACASTSTKTALVPEDEYLADDWLEDDLGDMQPKKKRKVAPPEPEGRRESSGYSSRASSSSSSSSSISHSASNSAFHSVSAFPESSSSRGMYHPLVIPCVANVLKLHIHTFHIDSVLVTPQSHSTSLTHTQSHIFTHIHTFTHVYSRTYSHSHTAAVSCKTNLFLTGHILFYNSMKYHHLQLRSRVFILRKLILI